MPILMNTTNAPSSIAHFSTQAGTWWDEAGPMRTLHHINPLRSSWINALAPVRGKRVLDIGCGGGILSESLAHQGARVLGIDLSSELIETAQLHAATVAWREQPPQYRHMPSHALAEHEAASFDIVCCMELLEHVDDPMALVQDCATLLKPGGWAFFSTINRHPLAFVGALVLAENLMHWVPPGTHRFDRLIRPSELRAAAMRYGLSPCALQGMVYNPLTGKARLASSTAINYLMACQKLPQATATPLHS